MAERGDSTAEPTVRQEVIVADADTEPTTLARGDTIDRYVVLERIGRGGMGVVYAAFDTALERRVALKLLRNAEVGTAGDRSRLIREAKVMAQLTHPNVVAVHDVGIHAGEVFVAMELVEGETLRTWIGRSDRGWRETLELLLAAGRGLAAAHRLQLVHRDVKPDNVLVGEDGRARVTDFGLARPRDEVGTQSSARARDGDGSPSGDLTGTGTTVGTPAYMAPEQHAGQATDPRADQFSFCVTVFEALYGRRPFVGKDVDEVRRRIMAGEITPPPERRGVPAAVHRALIKGLATDPRRRHDTLDVLLRQLERGMRRHGHRLGVAAGAVAVAGAIALGFGMGRVRGTVCDGGPDRTAAVWNASVRGDIEHAFAATKMPLHASSWARARDLVDVWIAQWQLMHRRACEATHVAGEQSERLLDLRMQCLADRLADLGTVVETYRSADAGVVERAVELAYSLPRVAECAETERLGAMTPPPTGPDARTGIDAIRGHLGRARAHRIAGRGEAGVEEAERAVALARELAYPPLLAEALLRLGELQSSAGRNDAAEATLHQAVRAAEAGGDDRLKIGAWTRLGQVVGMRLARFDEGLRHLDVAEATLVRLGGDAALRRELLTTRGAVLRDKGDTDGAAGAYAEAMELADELDLDPFALAGMLNNVGALRADQGRLDEAVELIERAMSTAEEALGPEHPKLVRYLTNLAGAATIRKRPEQARPYLERALAIADASLPHDHPKRAHVLDGLGSLLAEEGDWEGARQRFAEALAIHEAVEGKDHPNTLPALVNLGTALLVLERREESIPYFERALAVHGDPDLRRRGSRVIATRRLALAYVELGRAAPALELIEPLIAELERQEHPDPVHLGTSRFVRAQGLWQTGRRVQAREQAEQAHALLSTVEDAEDLENVERWLAEHP